MDTSQEQPAVVKPAITAEDVATFLVEQRAAHGLTQITAYCTHVFPNDTIWMVEHKQAERFVSGGTLAEALGRLSVVIMTPERLVAKKRADAAKLFAEADQLAAEISASKSEVAK